MRFFFSFVKFILYRFFLINTRLRVEYVYYRVFKHRINFKKPIDLNEKINWLKVYGNTEKWSLLADKYRVREYVEKKGLYDILVPLYGVWKKPDDINFDLLPKSFVLKTNHGSGEILIVKDKTDLDYEKVKKQISIWLHDKYGFYQGEPHYLAIKPLVLAEALLENSASLYSSSLVDYKVWCFNGKPYCIFTCSNRTKNDLEIGLYDLDWNYIPQYLVFSEHFKKGSPIPRPASLDRMIKAAKILSEGFPQVRVDFYDVDGSLYFGEMTFTSNGGYMRYFSKEYLITMGDFIKL